MKKTCNILFLILLNNAIVSYAGNQAVCIVPIADLVAQPLGNAQQPAQSAYEDLPIDGPAKNVKRIGQLLYNEIVTIQPCNDPHGSDEVKIQLNSCFYCSPKDDTPLTTYWTLKKNVMPLTDLEDKKSIPQALDYRIAQSRNDTITLLTPWRDQASKRRYSAGTRFVLCSAQPSEQYYYVYTLSPRFKTVPIQIPRQHCIQVTTLNNEEKIEQFLEILRWFAHQSEGFVPYVFGGLSVNASYHEKAPTYVIDRPITSDKPHQGPHSGVDCAGLILRSAQIAGLPFFYKNTSAIAHYLKPLTPDQHIQNGDLIYVSGHVMVVSDVDKQLLIEARTAQDGYGCVHECPLNEIFKEITTYDELRAVHTNNQPVTRIAQNGNPIVHSQGSSTARVKPHILSLRSLWA